MKAIIWVVASTTVKITLHWLLLKLLAELLLAAVVLLSPRKPSVDPQLLMPSMVLGVSN